MRRCRDLSILLALGLFGLAPAAAAAPTLSSVGSGEPGSLTVVVFGDSVTRAVNADTVLGQTLTAEQAPAFASSGLSIATATYLPEGQPVLAYQLMTQAESLARDSLGAVQGYQPYSLRSTIDKSLGRWVRVLNVAHPGGSYRTADAQLAVLQAELAKESSTAALIIVDLGRTDFALAPDIAAFRASVTAFFSKLRAISPHSRLLVTRLPDLVSQLDRPDRLAASDGALLHLTCKDLAQAASFSGHTGLVIGGDNTQTAPAARTQLDLYNAELEQAVASLRQDGAQVALVDTLDVRTDPNSWDQILAADCMNLNSRGQAEVAAHLLPAALSLLSAPPSQAPTAGQSSAMPPLSQKGYELWQDYLRTLPLADMQSECKPRLLMPDPSIPYKGMTMLVPGFSACGQVFDDLTPSLLAQGYAVVIPVLPGAGLKWSLDASGQKVDHTEALSTGVISGPHSYRTDILGTLVQQMNSIAAEFKGPRTMSGISLGASIANAITISQPYLWERQLLVSPFYEVDFELGRQLFGVEATVDRYGGPFSGIFSGILSQASSYGDQCEHARTQRPEDVNPHRKLRAGMCQFHLTNVLAINQVGYDTWSLIAPTTIKTQVLMVQDDPVINRARAFNAVGRMRNEVVSNQDYVTQERLQNHPVVRSCYAPSNSEVCKANMGKPLDEQQTPCISHPFLFGYDEPEIRVYYLPVLIPKMTAFLTAGEFFSAEDKTVDGDPFCAGFPE